MKKVFLALLLIVAFPVLAHAQAPANNPPVDRIRFTTVGGVSPVTNDIQITAVTGPLACTPNPSGVVHNPGTFEYKVNAADTQCFRYTDPGNGPLLSLPFGPATGSYTSTMAFVTTTNVVGAASNVSNPFDRPGQTPTAPAALKVLP